MSIFFLFFHVIWKKRTTFAHAITKLDILFAMSQEKEEIASSITQLWDPLTDEQRQVFVDSLLLRQFHRNEVIYSQGDSSDYLYYLIRGTVAISREGIANQTQIVNMAEPGCMFGYAPAFDNSEHISKATATSEAAVAMIPMEIIFRLIWENSAFSMVFIRELAYMLGASVSRTISLTQKHIRGRLAESLLLMKQKYGVERDGQTLAVYLSRKNLAQMSNMTTSNAIRTLSSFAQEGLIEIEGRQIKFLNESGLKRISELG